MVKVAWDRDHADMGSWQHADLITNTSCVESSGAKPVAVQPVVTEKGYALDRARKRPKAFHEMEDTDDADGERLSIQLYCSYPADVGALHDLSDPKRPWHTTVALTPGEKERAAKLMEELYLASEVKQPSESEAAGAMAAWQPSMAPLQAFDATQWPQHNPHRPGQHDRPAALAEVAIGSALVIQGNEAALKCSPYSTKGSNNYTAPVAEALGAAGVDVISRDTVTGEAGLAAITLANGECWRVPEGARLTVQPAGGEHPAYELI